ncbi:hypothetical protein REPUB_Repub06bG0068400 [Reevesia pubescens]
MAGIVHKIGETLHMGGNKKEEEKRQGEGQYGHQEYKGSEGYHGVEQKEENKEGIMGKIKSKIQGEGGEGHHGEEHKGSEGYHGEEHKGSEGYYGGEHKGEKKEGIMGKITGGGHGHDGEKKKKKEKKKHGDGHESSSSDSD